MKNAIIILLVALAAIACGTNPDSEGVKPVNTSNENVAILGYDPVAYFTANAAVEGDPRFVFDWNGAKWQFSSDDNLQLFKNDPAKFAPQFGGYCAWAVSHGYTANGDPTAWKIVDGKLYLNYNLKVKEKWEAEQEKLIRDGETNWPEFKRRKPEHKG